MTNLEIIALQHTPFETVGTIGDAVVQVGLKVRPVRVYDGEPVPSCLASAAGLIIMGGPMGVYEQDRLPFLRDELHLIEKALADDVPVLGICLGSQLLATALGSSVRKGKRKELGWHRVFLDPSAAADPLFRDAPPEFTGFHWHGDIFDLPPGTVQLARTFATECQAFRHGRNSYGILFHPEVTTGIVSAMIEAFDHEIREEGIDAAQLALDTRTHLESFQTIGAALWKNWVS
ncbi:MAG TPA: type 1 glutamine amidotransferase, partial [Bryobacteraceae bacterium]